MISLSVNGGDNMSEQVGEGREKGEGDQLFIYYFILKFKQNMNQAIMVTKINFSPQISGVSLY